MSLTPDDGKGRYISYAVYLNDLAQDALFFAGTPQYMRIDSLVVRRPFGNYSTQFSDSRTVAYQVYSRMERLPQAAKPRSSLAPGGAKRLSATAAHRSAHSGAGGKYRGRRNVARRGKRSWWKTI